MGNAAVEKSSGHVGCLVLLATFSVFLATIVFPQGPWPGFAALALLTFLAIFARVGWFFTWTIAGFYGGVLLSLTAAGSVAEVAAFVLAGTIIGFLIGAVADADKTKVDRPPE